MLKDGGFWSQAYVDLLDLPAISPLLDEIYGARRGRGCRGFGSIISTCTRTGCSTRILAGSHKSHLPVPEGWVDLSKGVHPMITRVPARAGSAIIFTEVLCHVTLPWTVPSTRTTLFYKYTKQGESYTGADKFFQPSGADGWTRRVDERTRAILTPPSEAWVERRAGLAEKEKESQ